MDIAVFVGFASAGPLHRPVAVEDVKHFQDIFGDDLALAWDPESTSLTYSYLGPAVRAFFRNGGLRCWVIRVSGEAETGFFPVPGLAQWDDGEIQPAFARARSPGSWFDAFECATALASSSLEIVGLPAPDFSELEVSASAPSAPEAGDLLRLTYPESGLQLSFAVTGAHPPIASPLQAGASSYVVEGRPLAWMRPVNPSEFSGTRCLITWTKLPERPNQPAEKISVEAVILGPESSPPTQEAAAENLTISAPADFIPPIGVLLRIDVSSKIVLWLSCENLEFHTDQAGSPPGRSTHILGPAFQWLKNAPPSLPAELPLAEKLVFELRARRGQTDAWRLIDLGFVQGQPRFWNALPSDQILFQLGDFDSSLRGAQALDHQDLWREALDPRFPLAGDDTLGGFFFPLAMAALPVPFLPCQNSGQSPLERDGVSDFGSALFLDGQLLSSGSDDLIADADFLRYQSPQPRLPIGLYAALEIDEATLIAVPDAIHRGWEPLTLEGAPEPRPPTVPTDSEPRRGQFLNCDLRVLLPPELRVSSQPDALGTFTLTWDSLEANPQFVLQEATESGFSDAATIYTGPSDNRTLYGHAPGNYYYRVQLKSGGETSNWSNGVIVEVGLPGGWQLKAETTFSTDAMLDIHRSLLRLCAARGDLLAALSLPDHFHEEEALAYLDRLKSPVDLGSLAGVELTLPLGGEEARALSYGALYHPWQTGREEDLVLRTTPPDGAALGVIARRTLERGAWIAPANEPWRGVVALSPLLDPDRRLDLLTAQLNQVEQVPGAFVVLNADTLSDDPDLRQINVRRLLILLRRAALQLGATYVFEPNGPALRRLVQRAFESLMDQLFVRGAFAGATRASSYQVVTGDSVNTPETIEQGRFQVDLRIAPSLPMSFVTVRLIQLGENSFVTELV
jgi:hypothetical protein